MSNTKINIVFIHIGSSSYLPITLNIARITNPTANFYLLGDAENKEVAQSNGWTHVSFFDLSNNDLQRFRECYRLISTQNNPDRWLPFDMTRFCFERYFFAFEFMRQAGMDKFWMFDSDDLLVEEIMPWQTELLSRGIVFTRMAHNTALRGLMNLQVVKGYCDHVISLFEDSSFVTEQIRIFSKKNTLAAFTDMNAAAIYTPEVPGCHLASSIKGWHFDDCIMHEDNFDMIDLGHLAKMPFKHVKFDGRHFTGIRSGEKINFATINGSGLPRQIFSWFLDCVKSRSQGKEHPGDITAYQPSLMRELAYIAKIRAKKLVGQ